MADLWLTGKRINLYLDRDTQFTLELPQVGSAVFSAPVLEMQRARSASSVLLGTAMVPVPAIVGGALRATWTAAMTGLINDLSGVGNVTRLRYRLRARSDGGPVRTLVSGYMNVGPIGYGTTADLLSVPIIVNTGDIVVGDVTIVEPDDPGTPDPDVDNLAFTEMWSADVAVAWQASVYSTYQ